MSNNQSVSAQLPAVKLISGRTLLGQDYPRYTNIIADWTKEVLNKKLQSNEFQIYGFIPYNFDFAYSNSLSFLVDRLINSGCGAIYGDYINIVNGQLLTQFLPSLTNEIVQKNFRIDVPFLCYGVNGEVFTDNSNWSALKMLYYNTTIYHFAENLFINSP